MGPTKIHEGPSAAKQRNEESRSFLELRAEKSRHLLTSLRTATAAPLLRVAATAGEYRMRRVELEHIYSPAATKKIGYIYKVCLDIYEKNCLVLVFSLPKRQEPMAT